jgi:hypothetical protein
VTADDFLAQMRALGYRAHVVAHGAIGNALDRAPAEALVSVVLVPNA